MESQSPIRNAGLRPGLLEKYQNLASNSEKFEFLKSFILDDLQTIEIEAKYVDMAERRATTEYIELPLEDLKMIFKSEVQAKFLQEMVVDKQKGVAHPQDRSHCTHVGKPELGKPPPNHER